MLQLMGVPDAHAKHTKHGFKLQYLYQTEIKSKMTQKIGWDYINFNWKH